MNPITIEFDVDVFVATGFFLVVVGLVVAGYYIRRMARAYDDILRRLEPPEAPPMDPRVHARFFAEMEKYPPDSPRRVAYVRRLRESGFDI